MEEREQESFDEPAHDVVSGADPRPLYAVIVVLLAVIVVLAIRPWGGEAMPPDGSDQGRASPGQAGEPTEAPDPSLAEAPTPGPPDDVAALVETCGSPSGWRAATLQAWAGRSQPIRSWIAVTPVEASGPLDPVIPFAPVATGIVTAIGYCAPLDEATRPPAVARASLWAIRDGRETPLSLIPLEPDSPDALGGLWSRPGEVTGGETSPGVWPPGRYVVEVASPGGEYRRWLGIEIADLALLRASPSAPAPSGSPVASSSPAASSSASSSVAPAP